ncbi:thiamine/thiamine pyrophosphate ABC transporter permease [Aquibium sp. ELW1220]|uniref:thiamine/thiamine pyrophosphate ABC transporter permease n=1 Tax=Aquibium sp. ELW1220 TaxID=2976766 RepID=UPI0025B06D3D|nr:thiamine/thiamine pyrophosphate ABC transporter permease [Aquibium sp. ELW1220]MDN2579881.1 thiamine/thiamine pyrophosphate ABC transporter permease [Aquibium sp. ELW1220]
MRAPPTSSVTGGIAALGFVALLAVGAFAGLLVEGGRDLGNALASFDAYLLRVARFTLWQALLSTLISVGPALLVARAFSRHPAFFGRRALLMLFALPLALPALVAALGILALLGRAGFAADLFRWLGGGQWPGIYGLSGILIAHAFFNLPLTTRLFLHALDAIPADQWRLASQLGMGASARWWLIEWPALRATLPGIAGLVFMLCLASFTIVLTLGGGPAATTLEVAIYQALRFDFDPARALALTALQVGLTVFVLALLLRLGADLTGDATLSVSARRYDRPGRFESGFNAAAIVLAAALVAGPIVAIVAAGLQADLLRLMTETAVRDAMTTSLVLATLSAGLCVALTLSMARARHRLAAARRGSRSGFTERALDGGASLILVIPPIVIGAGWFILLRHAADVFALAPVMVVTVNAAMAIPFAMRAIRPAHDDAATRHDRLCAQLGIGGFDRWRLIDWPSLRRPLATGFAFAMALSLGDLGVIALFGSDAVQTLPYLLFQRMGSYRTADAAGLALILALLCLALMMIAERLGGRRP